MKNFIKTVLISLLFLFSIASCNLDLAGDSGENGGSNSSDKNFTLEGSGGN